MPSHEAFAGSRNHLLGEASQLLAAVALAAPEDERVGAVVDRGLASSSAH